MDDALAARRMHRRLLAVVAVLAVAAAVAAAWLYVPPPEVPGPTEESGWVEARIEAVETVGPAAPFFDPESPEVDVAVTATLSTTGERVRFIAYADLEGSYRPGQRVLLAPAAGGDPERPFDIVDVRRERPWRCSPRCSPWPSSRWAAGRGCAPCSGSSSPSP
jgi:hypothetical protein